PYFVEWIRQDLEAQFGRRLYEGGLRIHTTLDLDMQLAAERAVENQLEVIESGGYSGNHFPGTTYRDVLEKNKASGENSSGFTTYLQGALVSLDVHTGAILAMAGGRDFDDSKYNRITQSLRQAGSTFKPFVYSAAIRAGHPVTEILDDTPLTTPVLQKDSTPWNPKDDDDSTWGAIPMRRALYASPNLATPQPGRW